MDIRTIAESLKNEFKDIRVFRFRLFNVKLFGNIRKGLYREISAEEVVDFISDFRDFCARNDKFPEEVEYKHEQAETADFRILKRLCEQYYVYEDTDRFQKKIIQEVGEIIGELRTDPKALKQLEQWLDKTHGNVVANLRKSHPELNENEIRLFCYIQAGFTPTMMSVLLQKDKSVIYNRVSRLKSKIK